VLECHLHLRIHTEEKPFEWCYCDKKFGYKSHFSEFTLERSHTNVFLVTWHFITNIPLQGIYKVIQERSHTNAFLVTRHFGKKHPLQGIYKVTLERSHSNVLNARANGANMLYCPTLLGPTCWRRLHTLLGNVACCANTCQHVGWSWNPTSANNSIVLVIDEAWHHLHALHNIVGIARAHWIVHSMVSMEIWSCFVPGQYLNNNRCLDVSCLTIVPIVIQILLSCAFAVFRNYYSVFLLPFFYLFDMEQGKENSDVQVEIQVNATPTNRKRKAVSTTRKYKFILLVRLHSIMVDVNNTVVVSQRVMDEYRFQSPLRYHLLYMLCTWCANGANMFGQQCWAMLCQHVGTVCMGLYCDKQFGRKIQLTAHLRMSVTKCRGSRVKVKGRG